jgi:hypothetical protein
LTFQTNPAGLKTNFDQESDLVTPFVRDTLINFQHTISAPLVQSANGKTYDFVSWSDGGATSHTITVPEVNQTFTATYMERPGPFTVMSQVNSSSDDVNEVNSSFTANSSTAWLGTGGSASNSYTGLRFTNLAVPQGATIISAKIEVTSSRTQWINIGFQIAADSTGNSQMFTTTNRPSQRGLTANKVNHTSDIQWLNGTKYQLNEMNTVIQEVVNRSDWQSGNSLSIILKGTVGTWGRKFIHAFDGSPVNAAKLIVTYQ